MHGAVMALRIRNAVALNRTIEALQASVGCALQLVSDPADAVVPMPAGNVGNIPFFPQRSSERQRNLCQWLQEKA